MPLRWLGEVKIGGKQGLWGHTYVAMQAMAACHGLYGLQTASSRWQALLVLAG